MMRKLQIAIIAGLVAFVFAITPTLAADKVIVASKIDTEGALLGNMIVVVLEANGIATENRSPFLHTLDQLAEQVIPHLNSSLTNATSTFFCSAERSSRSFLG